MNLALGKMGQEGREFKASLSYMVTHFLKQTKTNNPPQQVFTLIKELLNEILYSINYRAKFTIYILLKIVNLSLPMIGCKN